MPAGQSDYYLTYVGSEKRNKTLLLRAFDLGDVAANSHVVELLRPTGNSWQPVSFTLRLYPQSDRSSEPPQDYGLVSSFAVKTGNVQITQNRWAEFRYDLPADYAGGWWKVRFTLDGQASDRTTWTAGILDPAPVVTPTPCGLSFNDIAGSVFRSDILYLACRGTINGFADGSFRPDATTRRGEFAKLIVRAFGLPRSTPQAQSFSDVPSSNAFYIFVESAYAGGLLSGYSRELCVGLGVAYPCFGPNQNVTRAQTAAIIQRSGNYPVMTPPSGQRFADVPPGSFGYAAIENLASYGIINGGACSNGGGLCFRPGNPINRGELSRVLRRALERLP